MEIPDLIEALRREGNLPAAAPPTCICYSGIAAQRMAFR
jgi:hypothetical protein